MLAKVGSFQDYLDGYEQGVVDLKNPTCNNCNECCALLTQITEKEYIQLKKYFKTAQGKQILQDAKKRRDKLQRKHQAFSMMCPFTNGNKKCSIYPIRPQICKDFHCTPPMSLKYDKQKYEKECEYTLYEFFR